jgi:chromosome segregation ATPase
VALLVGFWRGSKTHATEQKGLVDKLDSIGGDVREVKGSLASLRDTQTSQGMSITALREQVSGHERRISRIEDRCDDHLGGTD